MPRFYINPYYGCAPVHESKIFALLRELLLTECSQSIRDDILSFWAITAAILARRKQNKHRADLVLADAMGLLKV